MSTIELSSQPDRTNVPNEGVPGFGQSLIDFPLTNHLVNLPVNKGVFWDWEQLILADFRNDDLGPNRTIEEDLIGLSGIAKSTLRYEEVKRRSQIGQTFTWDYELSIQIAENLGLVRNPSGRRTPEDFEQANKFDNLVIDLFFEHIKGPKFFIREKPAIPQDPIRKTGVTRGDWDFDRRDAHLDNKSQKERIVYGLLLGGEEEFRRENFWRRDKLVRLFGIDGDKRRASPLDAGMQHLMAIIDIVWDLVDNGLLDKDHKYYQYPTRKHIEDALSPGRTPNRAIDGTAIEGEGQFGNPEIVVEIVRDIIKPRIGRYVYGDPASARLIYLHNALLPEWETRLASHSKDELDRQFGIHKVLVDYATLNEDQKLMQELQRLKIPQMLILSEVPTEE